MRFYHKSRCNNEFILCILVEFTGLPSHKPSGEQIFNLFGDLVDSFYFVGPGKWGW